MDEFGGAAMPPESRDAALPADSPLALTAGPDEALDRIAEVVRRVLAVQGAVVALVDGDRQVFPGAAGLVPSGDEQRTAALGGSVCEHVVATGTPLVVDDVKEHPHGGLLPATPGVPASAYAGFPLHDLDGRIVGALCVVDAEPRAWNGVERSLLDDLATACSTDLQLRSSVQRASSSHRHTRILLELSERLSETRTSADVAFTVADAARGLLGAAFGGISELDPSGDVLRYVNDGSGAVTVGDLRMDSDTPSSLAIRGRRPVFVGSLAELRAISPSAAAAAEGAGGRSFAYLPLISRERTLGSLTLMWTESRRLSRDDQDVLAGPARYAAQALDRAQLLAERHEVARTLQAALLPALPEVPWLELAGRYLPAYRGNDVGGDWYDAYRYAEDEVFVTVGDVSGHDTGAAAAMGQLRAAARAIVVDVPDEAAAVLSRLERVMASLGFERVATALAARITRDATGAVMCWSNAGHPPMLLLEPGRPATLLADGDGDPLLGVDAGGLRRGEHVCVLPAGSTLLLFTDGLVERRDRDLSSGLDWLVEFAEQCRHLELPLLVDALIEAAPHEAQFDDTVVLGLRVGPSERTDGAPEPARGQPSDAR